MSDSPTPDPTPPSIPMILLRYVLPAAVVIGGLVVMALGSEAALEGGAGIVSAGLAIYFMNWLFRAGAPESTSATARTPPATTSTGTGAGRLTALRHLTRVDAAAGFSIRRRRTAP